MENSQRSYQEKYKRLASARKLIISPQHLSIAHLAMAHDILKELEFPKNTDINTLEPQCFIDWGRAEGLRAFFMAINGHPYDQWEQVLSLVPYHGKGTVISLSSDGKNITIEMPRGHTNFEYKAVRTLIDLKTCGYAFSGIIQRDSNTTELQDLFACARRIMWLDQTCHSWENRDAIRDSLRKLVSGNLELELAAAEYLGLACDQIFREYHDLLDAVNATAESIVNLFAGIISGATQLEALMGSIRGKTAKELESSRADKLPTQYWLSYAQRMDRTFASLDLSILDVWQVCWSEVQSKFGNIISQSHVLSDTFLAVDMDRCGDLAEIVAGAPDIAAQLQEIFELADQALLIVQQFVETEERMNFVENIFSGIDCRHPLTFFPVKVFNNPVETVVGQP